jgi:hypothetical protein
MHPAAANELPERVRIGLATGPSHAKQAIGDGIGGEKESDAEPAIEVEQPQELVTDRRNHPPEEILVNKRENIHARLPPCTSAYCFILTDGKV